MKNIVENGLNREMDKVKLQENNQRDEQILNKDELLKSISNIEIDEDGYVYFTIETFDSYELEGLYRIHDPANGEDNSLVSIDYGYHHPEIKEYWKEIENRIHELINPLLHQEQLKSRDLKKMEFDYKQHSLSLKEYKRRKKIKEEYAEEKIENYFKEREKIEEQKKREQRQKEEQRKEEKRKKEESQKNKAKEDFSNVVGMGALLRELAILKEEICKVKKEVSGLRKELQVKGNKATVVEKNVTKIRKGR